jgi:integrase/recombinase XerD
MLLADRGRVTRWRRRARNLGRQTQRDHIRAGKLFAAYLKRSPETATPDDVRLFQLSLIERGHTGQCGNTGSLVGGSRHDR